MNKEQSAVNLKEMEAAKEKEDRKREKKRDKMKRELLKGVQMTSAPDKEDVDKEKVISVVAEEMLKVLALWPAEIQELVGTEQPNKDSFANGISYVVRAYLLKARRVLRSQTATGIREAEIMAAKDMGPLHDIRSRLVRTKTKVDDNEIERLKAARDHEIKEATNSIRAGYEEQIKAVHGRASGEITKVLDSMTEVENHFLATKNHLAENELLLASVITELEKPYAEELPPPVKLTKETAAVLAVAGAVGAL